MIKLNLKIKGESIKMYFIEIKRPSGMKTYVGTSLEEIWTSNTESLRLEKGFISAEEAKRFENDVIETIKSQGTMISSTEIIEIEI